MAALAIIGNPKKRRKARKVSKARAHNPARKVKRAKRRRSNPVSAGKVRHVARRKMSRSRRRSNPIAVGDLKKLAMPALIGAVGAIAVDEIANRLIAKFGGSLPVGLQGGLGKAVAEAAIAIGLGMALEKTKLIKNAQTRNGLVLGALTGIGIQVMNNVVLPKLRGSTSVSGYQLLDVQALNGYQLAAAPVPAMAGLGYMNSSPTVGVMRNVRDFRKGRTV